MVYCKNTIESRRNMEKKRIKKLFHPKKKTATGGCGLCCIKINNFTVKTSDKVILDDVNLHIHCGELTTIVGPNGAGKSTLLKAILGEEKHTGTISFTNANDQRVSRPLIGYVPQQLAFDKDMPITVRDLFQTCLSRRPVWLGRSRRAEMLARESLARFDAEKLLDAKLGVLSGGELQRVMLALALQPMPNLLLLDEPVSGVDQMGLDLFYQMVADLRDEYDMSIILVSHDLELAARYSDRIVLINQKVLLSGTPKDVFADPIAVQTFGRQVLVDDGKGGGV